jgi:transposase
LVVAAAREPAEAGPRHGVEGVAVVWGDAVARETFKFSTDPELVAKVTDVIGLYLAPPENAIVLCVDEKSQIQALDRTQKTLPMQPGHAEQRTHDYVRYGTTTLFAALEIATGKVTGLCKNRHRHQEFLAFLKHVARAYPDGELHLVMDNYAAHKRVEIRSWLAANPRIQVHFTPTSGSWLNLVEVWFGIIERQAIHRGSFRSVRDLMIKIRQFIDGWNDRKHPFIWTKTADDILDRINRKRISTPDHRAPMPVISYLARMALQRSRTARWLALVASSGANRARTAKLRYGSPDVTASIRERIAA